MIMLLNRSVWSLISEAKKNNNKTQIWFELRLNKMCFFVNELKILRIRILSIFIIIII